jgi:hypothetical protein
VRTVYHGQARPSGLTTPGLSTLFQRFKTLPLAEYLAHVIDRSSSANSVGDFGGLGPVGSGLPLSTLSRLRWWWLSVRLQFSMRLQFSVLSRLRDGESSAGFHVSMD